MSAYRPFAFDRDFHQPLADPRADEQALAAAFAAAEARGFAAGEAAATARLEAASATGTQAALEALVTRLDTVEDEAGPLADRLAGDAAALAISAAELLAGQLVNDRPTGAIGDALARILGELRRGLPLSLWVHPTQVGEIEALVDALQRGERRQRTITVKADAALAPGDGRLTWEQGSALVDAASRRAALERLLNEQAQND